MCHCRRQGTRREPGLGHEGATGHAGSGAAGLALLANHHHPPPASWESGGGILPPFPGGSSGPEQGGRTSPSSSMSGWGDALPGQGRYPEAVRCPPLRTPVAQVRRQVLGLRPRSPAVSSPALFSRSPPACPAASNCCAHCSLHAQWVFAPSVGAAPAQEARRPPALQSAGSTVARRESLASPSAAVTKGHPRSQTPDAG